MIYEMMSFFYAFNFHNFGFLMAAPMIFFLLNDNDYGINYTEDHIWIHLFIGTMAYMVLTIMHFGMPLLSALMSKSICPLVMFLYGYSISMTSFQRFQTNLMIMSVGTFLHGFLNYVKNINVNVLNVTGRTYVDIAGSLISATQQNVHFVMGAALMFYFLVCCRRPLWVRGAGAFMAVGGVMGSMHNASRTVILLTGLLFFFSLVLYLYNENEHLDTMTIKLAIIGTLVLVAAAVLYLTNAFDIQGKIANSALGQRLESTANTDMEEDMRWVFAGDVLQMLPMYPWGDIPYGHYAHNLWVDCAKDAGLIPFIAYIFFAYHTIRKVVWMIRSYLFTTAEKLIVVPVTAGLFFVFFLEPIIQGCPWYFSYFCYIAGGLTCMTDCAAETNMLEIIPEKRVHRR